MKKKATTPPPELESLIGNYAKAYPGINTFIVTSDRMVFLPRQSGEATAHQKALNSKNQRTDTVQIYKRPAGVLPRAN